MCVRWSAFFLLSFVLPAVVAQSGHITLLALVESENETTGGTADLSLEIRDGTGRVFLDTFPLTKVATQISMRFAQQVVCAELQVDCSAYDFIYTINASPGIVGGPSAGGAAAVLTASLLQGWALREDVAMTGTINSGGLIGPVGGLKDKISAAGASGIRTVLIPRGARVRSSGNETVDLVEVGRAANVSVIEIESLVDAVEWFTGKRYAKEDSEIAVDAAYAGVMETVASDLCNEGKRLLVEVGALPNDTVSGERRELAENLTRSADELVRNGSFYSAASYCFRANIIHKTLLYRAEGLDADEVVSRAEALRVEVDALRKSVASRPQRTIADVETHLAVSERITEAGKAVDEVLVVANESGRAAGQLAYAEARLGSARAWSRFFDLPAKAFAVDQSALRNACQLKISEAEERLSYVSTIVPDALGGTREVLESAYGELGNGSFGVCLQKASKAKAEADVLLSVVGYEPSHVAEVIDFKLSTVRRSLARAQERGLFPLVAYSYYEYASSLREQDQYSALLFSEYALELSNLDIYFGSQVMRKKPSLGFRLQGVDWRVLVGVGVLHGFLAGVVTVWIIAGRKKARKSHRHRR